MDEAPPREGDHERALRPLTRENDSHFDPIREAMGLPADTKEIRHDWRTKNTRIFS